MSSSGEADTATLALQWIETHIALFVVLVISAVLLLVILIAVPLYCCCCRRKRGSLRDGKGGLGSNAHGDSVDASSGVTATIRGTTVVEIDAEKEHQNQQAQNYQYQASVSAPGIEESQKDSARLEDVRLQQSSQAELHAEFVNLPSLPRGVEVTKDAEMRLHDRSLPEVQADMTAAAVASVNASAADSINSANLDGSMRLPRTEVVLQTEIQPQKQQPLRSSPKKAAAPAPTVVIAAPETVSVRLAGDGRPSHEHRHGSSIYQSDENEITIVDSDFSDYEDTPEDLARKRATKLKSRVSAGLAADVELDVTGGSDFGWETLPNQPVSVEEPPIMAVDRQGEEYIPAPSPSLEEQQMRRTDNLAELDRTLNVFELDAEADSGSGIGFEVGGRLEVGADAELVDEEAIEPLDRSQVPH